MAPLLTEARRRLASLLGLSSDRSAHALSEVLDSFRLEVDDYILTRHAELQAQGVTNSEIYERIAAELPLLRFKAPALSARQIRRRIYG